MEIWKAQISWPGICKIKLLISYQPWNRHTTRQSANISWLKNLHLDFKEWSKNRICYWAAPTNFGNNQRSERVSPKDLWRMVRDSFGMTATSPKPADKVIVAFSTETLLVMWPNLFTVWHSVGADGLIATLGSKRRASQTLFASQYKKSHKRSTYDR